MHSPAGDVQLKLSTLAPFDAAAGIGDNPVQDQLKDRNCHCHGPNANSILNFYCSVSICYARTFLQDISGSRGLALEWHKSQARPTRVRCS